MNPTDKVAYAAHVISTAAELVSAGLEVADLLASANEAMKLMVAESRDPTDAEWAAVNETITQLRAKLHS